HAGSVGGGILITNGTDHTISNGVTIAGNTATVGFVGGVGGGVFVDAGYSHNLTIANSTIGGTTALTANSAHDGGGIAWNGSGTLKLTDSQVQGNAATGAGGGIYQTGG